MKTFTSSENLNQKIALLEIQKQVQWNDLKEEFNETLEHLKPVNLIKSAFKGTYDTVTHSPDIKNGIGKAAIGLTTGYLLKRLLFSAASSNPLIKLAGLAFQTASTNVIANHTDKIKSVGTKVFDFIRSKIKK